MPDVPNTFDRWIKDAVAPEFRRLGFRGSGQSFSIPDDMCWILLGIQRSTSSTADRVRFTLNLSVANKLLWSELRARRHPWLSEKPSANSFAPGQVHTRIGEVLGAGEDLWWEFDRAWTRTGTESLRDEVVAAVRDHGRPELERLARRQSDTAVRRQLQAIERGDRRAEPDHRG